MKSIEGNSPLYIDQQSTLIEKGLNAGMGQPLIIFNGYSSTYEQHITKTPEENFYYSPFLKLPDQISKQEKDSLLQAAKKVINHSVIPSFKKVKTFFEETYFLRLESLLVYLKYQMEKNIIKVELIFTQL